MHWLWSERKHMRGLRPEILGDLEPRHEPIEASLAGRGVSHLSVNRRER